MARIFAKAWDMDELKQKGALNPDRKTAPPNLTGDLLPIFLRDRWRLKDEDDDSFDLLQQSLLLASRLIEVGLPYIASFLPSEPLFSGQRKPAPADVRGFWEKATFENSSCPLLISVKNPVTWTDCNKALSELEVMSEFITWQTDPFIFNRNGWRGITMLLDCDMAWDYKTRGNPEAILTVDERLQKERDVRGDQRYTRRPLYIAIMSEYVDTIRYSPPDSEAHLRATFMAGITIAHEVGHAILHQDFRSWTRDLSEPFVGGGCAAELVNSFISWIFDGYLPEVMYFGDWDDVTSLNNPLYWQPHHNQFEDRPYYRHLRSMSTDYIQGILTQASWDSLGERRSLKYAVGALNMLREDLLDESANTIAIEPDFEWSVSAMVWRSIPGKKHRNPKYNLDAAEYLPNIPVDEINAAEQWRIDMGLIGEKDVRFNDLDLRVDDDEEEYIEKVEEGVKELPMDVSRMAFMPNGSWTRIEVKFRPSQTAPSTNLKRHREDELEDELGAKRLKAVSTAQVINAIADINDFGQWDYSVIWNLCRRQNLGILHGDEFDADERGGSKWDRKLDAEDHMLMERVRNWKIREQEKKLPGNTQALLAFRKLSLRFLDRWDKSDFVKFCNEHNITADENTTENNLLTKVRDYKRSEIRTLEQRDGPLAVEVEELLKIEGWCEGVIRVYCAENDLLDPYAPNSHLRGQHQLTEGIDTTDTKFVQLPRALAVVRKHATRVALEHFPTMQPLAVRPKEANGDIVFKFKAVLNCTSTKALLRALVDEIRMEAYPSGSQPALFFERGGREDTLNMMLTLGVHTGRDWTDLRLVISPPAMAQRLDPHPQTPSKKLVNFPSSAGSAAKTVEP